MQLPVGFSSRVLRVSMLLAFVSVVLNCLACLAAPVHPVAAPVPSVAAPLPTVADLIPAAADPSPTVADLIPSVAAPSPTVADLIPAVADPAPVVVDSTPRQAGSTQEENFNLSAYMGRWFQYSETSSFASALSWRFRQCVTYEHTLMSPAETQPLFFIVKRSMNLINIFSKKRIRATPSLPNTYEYRTAPKGKKFTVIEVGPIVEGEYQYAVVQSAPSSLKILVRDLDFYESHYKQEVDKKLSLDVDNRLGMLTQVKTRHTKHCRNNYAWNPKV